MMASLEPVYPLCSKLNGFECSSSRDFQESSTHSLKSFPPQSR